LADHTTDLDVVRSLLDAVQRSGFSLDASNLESALRQRLNTLMDRWMRNPGSLETLEDVEHLIALSRTHPFELNLWKSQNAYYELSQAVAGNGAGAVNPAWLSHFRGLGQWLGLALPQLQAPSPFVKDDPAA